MSSSINMSDIDSGTELNIIGVLSGINVLPPDTDPPGTDIGTSSSLVNIAIELIDSQPIIEREYDQEFIEDLARNIQAHGDLLEPIQVRPMPLGRYKIIFGHQRFAAVKLLGKYAIPAVVVEVSDQEAALRYISENVMHQDLNPIEKAAIVHYVREVLGWNWSELAARLGFPRTTARDYEALLSLIPQWQSYMINHPRTLRYGRMAADLPEGMQLVTYEYVNGRGDELEWVDFQLIVRELQRLSEIGKLPTEAHLALQDALVAFFRLARNPSAPNFANFCRRLRNRMTKGKGVDFTPEALTALIERSIAEVRRRPGRSLAAIRSGQGWSRLPEAKTLPSMQPARTVSEALREYVQVLSQATGTERYRPDLVVGRIYNELIEAGLIPLP